MTNPSIQYRSFNPELEVKSGGDGRTIYGIAVPYNAPTRIAPDLIEQFARSSFNHQLTKPNRVKYAREHVALGGVLIGALQMARDDAHGLYVELRVSKTPTGDETLELVRDGALPDLSIAFRERQNRRLPGGIVERVKADLSEVASVMEGAYGELATATGVRSSGGYSPGGDDYSADLRRQAEEFLIGLPDAPNADLAIRSLRLGIRL